MGRNAAKHAKACKIGRYLRANGMASGTMWQRRAAEMSKPPNKQPLWLLNSIISILCSRIAWLHNRRKNGKLPGGASRGAPAIRQAAEAECVPHAAMAGGIADCTPCKRAGASGLLPGRARESSMKRRDEHILGSAGGARGGSSESKRLNTKEKTRWRNGEAIRKS